jgi:hypothetical protein
LMLQNCGTKPPGSRFESREWGLKQNGRATDAARP